MSICCRFGVVCQFGRSLRDCLWHEQSENLASQIVENHPVNFSMPLIIFPVSYVENFNSWYWRETPFYLSPREHISRLSYWITVLVTDDTKNRMTLRISALLTILIFKKFKLRTIWLQFPNILIFGWDFAFGWPLLVSNWRVLDETRWLWSLASLTEKTSSKRFAGLKNYLSISGQKTETPYFQRTCGP